MTIEKCSNNVRCHVAGCRNFAICNIDTNGFKGNLCLCNECLQDLEKSLKKFKNQNKTENK